MRYVCHAIPIMFIIFLNLIGLCCELAKAEEIITLEKAINLTLQNYPDLQAYSEALKSADTLIAQTKRYPNPELEIITENLGQDEVEITFNQLFEFGGKRSARQNNSMKDKDIILIEFEIAQKELIAGITDRFLDALETQMKLSLQEESVSLAQRVFELIKKRVEIGATPEVEKNRAAVALILSQIQRDNLISKFNMNKKTLALLWSGKPDFEKVEDRIITIAAPPEIETLYTHLPKCPELLLQDELINKQQFELVAEQASSYPDISLTGGYLQNNADDEQSAIVGISVPLPIFDRNQEGIAIARSKIEIARHNKQTKMIEKNIEFDQLYLQLSVSYKEIQKIEYEALPAAESVFREIERLTGLGKMSLLDLLDSQQTLIEISNSLIDTQIIFLKTRNQLEKLIGISFDKFNDSGGEPYE